MVRKTCNTCASTASVSSTCACSQTERLSMDASTQILVWFCRDCNLQFPLTDIQAGGTIQCERCLLVESLRQQVGELQEEVARLRSSRIHEQFLDSVHVETAEVVVPVHRTADTPLVEEEMTQGGHWQLVTSGSRQCSTPAPNPPAVVIGNHYALLDTGEKESPPTVKEEKPRTSKAGRSAVTTANRKRRVVVVRDSLLRRTEAPICRPDISSREACCLPGARIQNVMEALSRIIQPSDYYPMLLIHVGTNDIARCDTERIKSDYRALGVRVKEFGAQVVFSSILPVKSRGLGRNRCIMEENAWLRRWCRQESFGFLDHGMLFEEGLLGKDGVHLSRRGKTLFGHRLANLVMRALN
uniref:SGNH hydrolase-type esterase domain-containing protein n=1 Tax=Chrysemys picta bellii TaxID=8478 RepID=A0A8C3IF96_CHRPI